jgi:hypothetical protein
MRKRSVLPKITRRKGDPREKSSGKTPGKPRAVAAKSRELAAIPADRGAREKRSATQGSE